MRKLADLTAMVLIFLSAMIAQAFAEPVYVEANETIGQAWAFKRGDACLAITAAHVAQLGAVVTSTRRQLDGRFLQAQATSVNVHPPNSEGQPIDLAIMVLEGPLKAKCPASQLGYAQLGPTLDRIMSAGLPVVMSKAQQETGVSATPVRVHAVNADGVTFVVAKGVGGDGAIQGESGSVLQLQSGGVAESGMPLGIVTQSLGGSGLIRVIRFDVARAFVERTFPLAVRSAPTPSASASASPRRALELVDFSGATPDPACGPLAALSATGCGWKSPLSGRRYADLMLTAPAGFPRLSGIQLRLSGTGGAAGVEISTTEETATETTVWTTASVCRAASPGELSCRFAERATRTVRLRIFGDVTEVSAVALN